MKYQNERHKMAFKDTSNRTNKRNDILMAVLYLLTADHRLWNLVRPYVDRNEIMFDRIKIKSVSEKAYTLFMTAKDIYLGTDHIHFIDLADTELIDDRMFGLKFFSSGDATIWDKFFAGCLETFNRCMVANCSVPI